MKIGIVVIGRNEGKRLFRCLSSLEHKTDSVVYVDSGSSDRSVFIAEDFKVGVLRLDESIPFSAARARNEGFDYLIECFPDMQFVQFIDGDCCLSAGWLECAAAELEKDNDCAAVMGHLQELHPEHSLYNRLCALEWRSSAVGDLTRTAGLGGISMIRARVFQQLKGFNANLIAGEEPELAVRMALANYKVIKIDQSMATHDADMHQFSQWWKRAVRSGHAIAQRAFLNGKTVIRDGDRERKSAWFWGLGVPVTILFTCVGTEGWSLFLLAGYPLLAIRIYRYRRRCGDEPSDALIYSVFIVLSKFAEVLGMIKFYRNHFHQRYTLIEYK